MQINMLVVVVDVDSVNLEQLGMMKFTLLLAIVHSLMIST